MTIPASTGPLAAGVIAPELMMLYSVFGWCRIESFVPNLFATACVYAAAAWATVNFAPAAPRAVPPFSDPYRSITSLSFLRAMPSPS